MTNQDTIKRLEYIRENCSDIRRSLYSVSELKESLDMATNAISALDKIKNIISLWVYNTEKETSDVYCNVLDLIEKYMEGEGE